MSRDFVTVVTGVPRSGTSLVMQMLEAGGVPPLYDDARPADPDNPRGYYELAAVKRIAREGAPWLCQAAGRAVKVIHALAPSLPAGGDYRLIWVRRARAAVLDSQRTMLERGSAAPPALPDERDAAVFAAQERSLRDWLAVAAPARWLQLDYDAVVDDPPAAARAIDALLGGGLDRAALANAVDPALRRH